MITPCQRSKKKNITPRKIESRMLSIGDNMDDSNPQEGCKLTQSDAGVARKHKQRKQRMDKSENFEQEEKLKLASQE